MGKGLLTGLLCSCTGKSTASVDEDIQVELQLEPLFLATLRLYTLEQPQTWKSQAVGAAGLTGISGEGPITFPTPPSMR